MHLVKKPCVLYTHKHLSLVTIEIGKCARPISSLHPPPTRACRDGAEMAKEDDELGKTNPKLGRAPLEKKGNIPKKKKEKKKKKKKKKKVVVKICRATRR